MSNNPGELGPPVYQRVGYKYDRAGEQQFLEATKRLQQAVKQQQPIIQATSNAEIQAAARVQTAQIAGNARIEQQRLSSVARVESAEKQAAARVQAAQITADQRVEAERIRALNRLELAQRRQAQQGAALPRTFAGFTGQGALQLAGAVGIATSAEALTQQLVQVGRESVGLAVQAQTIGTAFEASTGRAGVATDALLNRLKAASRGTVSETGLMLSANKALALGVGEDIGQIGDLLAIARQKGKDFGIGTEQAFEDIVTGLGRASPLILDNLGIVIDLDTTYREYAKTLGKTSTELTEQEKKQALVNEVIRTNTDLIQKNADAQIDAADKIAAADARRRNAQVRLGNALLPAATEATNVAAGAADLLTGNMSVGNILTAMAPTGSFNELTASLLRLTNPTSALAEQLRILGAAEDDAANDADELTEAAEQTSSAFDSYAVAARDATRRVEEHTAAKQAEANAVRDGLLALQQGRLAGEADGRQSEQDAILRRNDERKAAISSLQSLVISSGEQIVDAEERKNERLDDLEDSHTRTVERLVEQRTKIQIDAAADVAKEEGKYLTERADLVAENNDRIEDLVSGRARSERRLREDQQRSDARSLEDFNEDQADALANYQDRRQQLLDQQHEQEIRDEADYQRELARATRQGQLDQYQSTASFLGRLYGLTRGRRNKGQLAEARTALEAARAEAAELARTDPQAAAALLAERQRQILTDIERKREEAQLRRDARRGGGLGAGDVEDEIRLVNEAQAAADAAALDAIRAGANDRAADRDREKGERGAANQEALDDLDRSYADQKTAREAARREQIQRQDEDRRLDKQRRDADYAAQLQELVDSNAARLAEFDQAHRDRITQIRTQATENATAIDAALALEDKEYGEARKKINDDYDTFLAGLKTKIEDGIKAVNLSPDAAKQLQETEAWARLGEAFGTVFSGAAGGAIDWAKILTPPGGDAHDRHPSTGGGTATTSQAGVNQIVRGGRLTQGFSAGHTGNDIAPAVAGRTGDPVTSPTEGTVETVGAHPEYGNYVIIRGGDGSRWYFGHLEKATVKRGDNITRGQTIGRLGSSGSASTAPHVHFEYAPPGGGNVNPASVLNQLAASAPAGSASVQAQSYGARASYATPERMAWERMGGPSPASAGATGGAATSVSRSVTVDLRGAHFGAGLTEQQVRSWFRPVVDEALTNYEQGLSRDIEGASARGSYSV